MKHTIRYHENNFDLIRLFAALQVLLLHHLAYFNFGDGEVIDMVKRLIWNFPGVNIFFIISGYLIFQSVDRNATSAFTKNRLRRIFPGLVCCFLFTIILLISFDSLTLKEMLSFDFLKWIAAQLTIFQFYNPDIVRDFGFSPPNGALWTISVELQFYILMLCLGYWLVNKSKKTINIILILIFIASAAYNYFFNSYLQPENLFYKLSFVFVLSYLYFFVAGILIYVNRNLLIPKFRGRALIWISVFVIICIFLDYFQIRYHRYVFNGLSFVMLLLLICLVFSMAFSNSSLAGRVIKGNDISYGIYIYQMPIINVFFHLGCNTHVSQLLLSLCICVVIGMLSWFLLEKRFLKR